MKSKPNALVAFCVLVFAAAGPASAHDKSLHKGKPIEGEVLSVSPGSLELKTADGKRTVTLTDKTKIERGETHVEKTAIKPGEHVSVFGNKTEGGIFAKEVVIGTGHPHADRGGDSHVGHESH
jgi:hypothetical protein